MSDAGTTKSERIATVLMRFLLVSLALAVVIVVILFYREVMKSSAFGRCQSEIRQSIQVLKHLPPPDWPPGTWEDACFVVDTAIGNACLSYHVTPVADMERLRDDIRELVASEPKNAALLRKIWERIGATSRVAGENLKRYTPLLDEALAPIDGMRGPDISPDSK